VQVLVLEEKVAFIEVGREDSLKELGRESVDLLFDFLGFLLSKVWRAKSLFLLAKYRFKILLLIP
jgi:hypothetical protein